VMPLVGRHLGPRLGPRGRMPMPIPVGTISARSWSGCGIRLRSGRRTRRSSLQRSGQRP
jgi:hypothetical protein